MQSDNRENYGNREVEKHWHFVALAQLTFEKMTENFTRFEKKNWPSYCLKHNNISFRSGTFRGTGNWRRELYINPDDHILVCFLSINCFEWTIKQLSNSAFLLSEKLCRSQRMLAAEADNILLDFHNSSLRILLSLIQSFLIILTFDHTGKWARLRLLRTRTTQEHESGASSFVK